MMERTLTREEKRYGDVFFLRRDRLPERTLEKRSGVPARRQSEALSLQAMDLFQKTHIEQVFTTHAHHRTYRHAALMLR